MYYVQVTNISGKKMDLKLSGGDTVAKLKHKVAKEYDGYEADRMRLVYTTAAGVNGELTNDQLTLFEVCSDRIT